MSVRIGLIGGGFMGEAFVSAALKGGVSEAAETTVSDVVKERRDHLASQYGVAVTSSNAEAVLGAEVVLLAVKPQEFERVSSDLRGKLSEGQTAVTIMAGVPLRKVVEGLGHSEVARVMPNAAAFVGEAMSVWTATEETSEQGRESVRRLLRALGREVRVDDEKYLDMATAVSGSGPAFVFVFLEALIDAGVHIGLRRELAEELSLQTLVGAVGLARETGQHPAQLRNMVTSPGGTTTAGLQKLEDAGLRSAVIAAVEAAYERAKELGS